MMSTNDRRSESLQQEASSSGHHDQYNLRDYTAPMNSADSPGPCVSGSDAITNVSGDSDHNVSSTTTAVNFIDSPSTSTAGFDKDGGDTCCGEGSAQVDSQSKSEDYNDEENQGLESEMTSSEHIDSVAAGGSECHHACLLRFCCPECRLGFGSDEQLTEHIRESHNEEKGVRCSHCPRQFTNLVDRLLHYISSHGRKFYSCRDCQMQFVVAESSGSISPEESPEKDMPDRMMEIVCLLCYLSFNDELQLAEHMHEVHDDRKPCKCSICDKVFTSVTELQQHESSHGSPVFYTCEECDETMYDLAAFRRHKRAHKRSDLPEKPLPTECEECGKCYQNPELLLRHLETHSADRTYKCRHCDETFKDKSLLKKHKRQAHSEQKPEDYRCDLCDKVFHYAAHLKRHMTKHQQQKPFECEVCQQTFKAEGYLKKHMIRYHDQTQDDKIFKCTDCTKTFPTLANLKRHSRVHTGEKPYRCDGCDRSFSDQSNLVAHKKRGVCAKRVGTSSGVGTENKPFVCATCGKSFSQQNNLIRHERIHSGEKPFKCPHCDKPFADRSYLIKHCRVEHGVEMSTRVSVRNGRSKQSEGSSEAAGEEDPGRDEQGGYTCEHCGKQFRVASQLKRHIQIHSPKTLQCNECGKFMTSLGNLKAHERVHTGEKPYQCESCGNRFARLSTLIYHKRTHTGEKPHQCDKCGRGFSVSSALIKHKRSIHDGDKPYQCTHCGKFFSRTSNLKKHFRTHTGERPYQCEQCGRRFREKNHLTTHIRLIHSSERAGKVEVKPRNMNIDVRRHHLTSPNSAAESLLALSREDSVSGNLYVPRRDDQMTPPIHTPRPDLLASSLHHAQEAMVMVAPVHSQRRDDPMSFFPPRRDDPMTASLLAQRRPESMMYANPDIPLMLLKDTGYS